MGPSPRASKWPRRSTPSSTSSALPSRKRASRPSLTRPSAPCSAPQPRRPSGGDARCCKHPPHAHVTCPRQQPRPLPTRLVLLLLGAAPALNTFSGLHACPWSCGLMLPGVPLRPPLPHSFYLFFPVFSPLPVVRKRRPRDAVARARAPPRIRSNSLFPLRVAHLGYRAGWH